jgi:dihydroflavonol-4-reductase
MTRVLVTGANGHIGANTVRCLLKQGDEVVAFVRQNADLRGIESLGLAVCYGDVKDENSLLAAMQGCEVVIHHAAVFKTWMKDPDEMMHTAMVGTENVFRAGKKAGIRRLVFTSSIVAMEPTTDPGQLLSPADWQHTALGIYARAKTQSERLASELADRYGIPTIRLCPAGVLGPYDYRMTPSTRIILHLANGTMKTVAGGSNYAHAADVGAIHAAAVKRGEPGCRYLVGGENMTMQQLGDLVTQFTGIPIGHINISRPAAELFGLLSEIVSKIRGVTPGITRATVHDLIERYYFFDPTPTYRAFGLTPHSGLEMVKDTLRWLLFLGQIRPDIADCFADQLPPDPDWSRIK